MPYFFCSCLAFPANYSQKEALMKSKKTYQIPDSYYSYFGIYVSGTEKQDDMALFPDAPGKFFSESDRIVTLARESRLKSYFPVLRKIDLLSLNYPSLPRNPSQRAGYVKKVIRSSLKKAFYAISHDGKLCQACLDFVSKFFYLAPGSVSICICGQDDDAASRMVCRLFGSTEAIRITFPEPGSITVYANPFSRRKIKYGRYHLRQDDSVKAHVIDLLSLLADASVLNALFESLTCSSVPLVQNVYECCYTEIMQHPQRTPDEMQITEFIRAKKPVPYERLFHFLCTQNGMVPLEGMSTGLSSGLYKLFCEVLEIFQDLSHENEYREQMTHSIATAYMTKKNIPESILKAMEQTGFLHYFKYVEFDEDTDMDAVSAIEKEFVAMNKEYFSGSVFPDVNIRFRKLGKHKASGLYYPSLNTLCVDIRSPSSFMHEYFHMIDNQLGDLSLEVGFQGVVKQYTDAFLKGLEKESSSVKKKMEGCSKYNINYFFRRAEIFARCGEIYLMRILKAESSLLQPNLGYAYPESEALDSLIQGYYQPLLQEKLAHSVFAKAC